MEAYNSVVVCPTNLMISGVLTHILDVQFSLQSLSGGTLRPSATNGSMSHPVSSDGTYTALFLDISVSLDEFAALKQFFVDAGLVASSDFSATGANTVWFLSLKEWVYEFSYTSTMFKGGSKPKIIQTTNLGDNISVFVRNQLGNKLMSLSSSLSSTETNVMDVNVGSASANSLKMEPIYSAPSEVWARRKINAAQNFMAKTDYANFDADATTVVNSLGAGINIGQEWDALRNTHNRPGAYRNIVTTAEMFRRIGAAGFNHVRIPVLFTALTAITSPYLIDSVKLDRVFNSVDNALAAGLTVILDNHGHKNALNHSDGDNKFDGGLSRAEQLARSKAMIVQVADRLNEYSYDKVLFEIENEPGPRFNSDWETYWPDALSGCRAVNQNTIFICPGLGSSLNGLVNLGNIADTRTCLVAHLYQPFLTFTHSAMNPVSGEIDSVWSDDKLATLADAFAQTKAQVDSRGKPCIITEIGVKNFVSQEHKLAYARDARNLCFERGMPFSYWNMYGDFAIASSAGFFTRGITEALTAKTQSSSISIPYSAGENILSLKNSVFGTQGFFGVSITANSTGADDAPGMTITDDTITIDSVAAGSGYALTIPYILNKSADHDEIREGRRFKLTFASTDPEARLKIELQEVRSLATISHGWLAFPKGIGANSVPPWGAFPQGVFELECYLKTNKYWLNDSAPLAFSCVINRFKVGDVITLKIEWLD